MKKLLLLPLLFLSFAHAKEIYQCKINNVIDGNTFHCIPEKEKKIISVKLANMEAPNLMQSFGEQAKLALKKYNVVDLACYAKNKQGFWECRAYYNSGGGCGSYNSPSIGYCSVPYEINDEMIAKGLAWYKPYIEHIGLGTENHNIENDQIYQDYRRYIGPSDSYLEHEKSAKEAKRGLWADEHAMPPWEWRKSRKKPYLYFDND